MRALSMALKWMSLNRRTTLYVSGRVIFAEDSDTGRSKCSANGSSCVSIVHIVLMRGLKSDMLVTRPGEMADALNSWPMRPLAGNSKLTPAQRVWRAGRNGEKQIIDF